jgi:hypothetical protein
MNSGINIVSYTMNQRQRTPNGRLMRNSSAVAADVITLLSGVNFGSVVKVLAAIDVLATHLGIDPADVVAFGSVPLERAQFEGNHEARVQATEALLREIIVCAQHDELEYVLKHRARFAERVKG